MAHEKPPYEKVLTHFGGDNYCWRGSRDGSGWRTKTRQCEEVSVSCVLRDTREEEEKTDVGVCRLLLPFSLGDGGSNSAQHPIIWDTQSQRIQLHTFLIKCVAKCLQGPE